MAGKNVITIGGRVINADYSREVKVLIRNHGTEDSPFKAGDRIAELIVEKFN